MAKKERMATGRIPLRFAAAVSAAARAAFEDGSMRAKVSPVTQELLKFWFDEPFTARPINFHEGQKQAILNVIYLHEVLGVRNVSEAYEKVSSDLLGADGGAVLQEVAKPKYAYPKYLVKMATGTGKTWVMHALLIWQYLNARAEKGERSGRWTKNFLFVAPGLIVYERLLDAFCGKRTDIDGNRDFQTSDIFAAQGLFVPPAYREAVFSFLQNCTVRKEDFGRKVTGDGLIAVMNWHAFLGEEDDHRIYINAEVDDPEGKMILDDLLPAKPGTAAGNALDALDAQFLRGGRLDFLKELPDLMVVNDEAHHVHGGKTEKNDELEAVKWQIGLDAIAAGKGERFFQLDFSATPYETSGTGAKTRENFFPHVMVDYDLKDAIRAGLVKTVVIDRRKELAGRLNRLDFNAERDANGKVIGLSEGQRTMLRAGLTKLDYLAKEFEQYGKSPKMMVVCEETAVVPMAESFLVEEGGIAAEGVLTIDSTRKGEVSDTEWEKIKGKLFGIDRRKDPRVIVSVLMLREGFDVNNICVIVPLRASSAQILLEQTLGRGLRLMWRESEFKEVKEDARRQLLEKKSEPKSVFDLLYIVEHPAFAAFYQKYIEDGLVGTQEGEDRAGGGTDDLVEATLKDGYENYDLIWPVVIREREDVFADENWMDRKLKPFTHFPLAQLKKVFAKDGEKFISQEMLVGTRFGEYSVSGSIFNATSYNEYLQKIIGAISHRFMRINGRQTKWRPALQVNLAQVAAVIDNYIRFDLFGEAFDPLNGSDWKVLTCMNGIVTRHIVEQIGELVHEMEERTETQVAEVRKIPFSSVKKIIVREHSSLELVKTIYTRDGYPAHGGGLEKACMRFFDDDAGVECFIKINEAKHVFARIPYLRTDGLLSDYIPDFIVAMADKTYLVETKRSDQVDDKNVQRKRMAAIEWCKRINELEPEDRMGRQWAYLLLSESDFYSYVQAGATCKDIFAATAMTEHGLRGEFSFD